MDDLVEIGAAAAFKDNHPDGDWSTTGPMTKELYRRNFRASLRALAANGLTVMPVKRRFTGSTPSTE